MVIVLRGEDDPEGSLRSHPTRCPRAPSSTCCPLRRRLRPLPRRAHPPAGLGRPGTSLIGVAAVSPPFVMVPRRPLIFIGFTTL